MDAAHELRAAWPHATTPLRSGRDDNIDQRFDSSDGGPNEHTASTMNNPERNLPPRYACPYYRRDPRKDMGCMTLTLTRIRDVKQHLQRRHAVPDWFCQRCHQPFSSESLRDSHFQQPGCVSRGLERVPDARSFELLRTRVDHTLTLPDQWNTIWKILFPQTPPPANPYLGSPVVEVLDIVRKLWDQNGRRIIYTLFPNSLPSEFHEACSMILLGLLDQVQEEYGHPYREESNIHRRPPDSQPSTTAQYNILQGGYFTGPNNTGIAPLESARTDVMLPAEQPHLSLSTGPGWNIGSSQSPRRQQQLSQMNLFNGPGSYNPTCGMFSMPMPIIQNPDIYPPHPSSYRQDDFGDPPFPQE